MEMLRDKIKGLERQIVEMVRHGQDNVAIADKLHRWTRALMLTANAADLPDVLVRELQPPVHDPAGRRSASGAAPRCSPALPFARPGQRRRQELRRQPGDAVLRRQHRLRGRAVARRAGARALDRADRAAPRQPAAARSACSSLASPDPTRYTADMGTEFLARIGEVASAALTRLLPAP